jgi:hypothetical protein
MFGFGGGEGSSFGFAGFSLPPRQQEQQQQQQQQRETTEELIRSIKVPSQNDIIKKMNFFYNENRENLVLSKSFPPNDVAIASWIKEISQKVKNDDMNFTKIGNTSWLTFASQFAEHLKYVSFGEFHEVSRQIASEIVANILALPQFSTEYNKQSLSPVTNINVILVIDGVFNKSNTWTSLLIWPIVSNYITHIVSSPLEALALHFTGKINQSIIIHPDDCSYTGSQFHNSFRQIPSYCKKLGIKPDQFKYYMTFPYVSYQAIEVLQYAIDSKYLIIPNKTIKIMSFIKQMEKDGINTIDLLKLLGRYESNKPESILFQWSENNHVIYFDHKLADSMSILNKVIAFSPVRDPKTDQITTRSLITGCNENDYKPNDLTQIIYDFNDENTCPLAFYKTILYSYNGKNIPRGTLEFMSLPQYLSSSLLPSSLNINCSMCKKAANYKINFNKNNIFFCNEKCYYKFFGRKKK